MTSPHSAPTDVPPHVSPGSPGQREAPAPTLEDATAATQEHAAIVASVTRRQPAPPRATFLRSFHYAASGLGYAIRTQRNMRVHLGLAAAALLLGLFLGISPVEFAVLLVTISTVIVAEMINTVAEACVDLASPTYHSLAKVAKDVAAGAVLLAAIFSVAVGLFLFVPHLWPLLIRLLGH